MTIFCLLEQKEEVQKLRDELKAALDANDIETLKTKIDQLEKAAQAMGEAMYQQQAQQQANAGAGAQPNNDDVVDADFKAKE